MALKSQFHVTVFGLVTSFKFYKVKFVLEDLQNMKTVRKSVAVPSEINCEALMESEWEEFISYQKLKFGRQMWSFRDQVLVFCNDKPIGGYRNFCRWYAQVYKYDIKPFPQSFLKISINAMRRQLQNTHPFVYLDFSCGKERIGRMVFELFTNTVPKTCENFRALCTGEYGKYSSLRPLHYKHTIIHRIVLGGWIQGGDLYGHGNGGESIFGLTFEDENFIVSHNRRGVLGMANRGKRNTNGSQFYITLAPNTWMNRKHVAFGQLVSGCDVLRMLEGIRTVNERPVKTVRIIKCGVCTMEEFCLKDLTLQEAALYLPSHEGSLDIPIEIDMSVICDSLSTNTLPSKSISLRSSCADGSFSSNESDKESSIGFTKPTATTTAGSLSVSRLTQQK